MLSVVSCLTETHVNLLVDHYSVVEGDDLMITIELSNQLDFNGIVYIITSPSNSSKSGYCYMQ